VSTFHWGGVGALFHAAAFGTAREPIVRPAKPVGGK